jgi:hypothetical protein
MTISNTPIVSTDFTRFLHDYVKHTPLQLTSAGFSITISNTLDVFEIVMEKPSEVSRGDGCVRYSHRKTCWSQSKLTSAGFFMTMSSTHLFNWLQQIFPWLCQAHTSSTDFSRFSHDYVKHTSLLKSVEEVSVFDIVMEKPAEVSQGDGFVWYSHGTTCWSQSRRWVC